MTRTILLTATIVVLLPAVAFAETTKESKLDWKFSDEIIQLFAPPMDATIEQMQTWADKLERPIPEDTEKWGGFEKYRERVALLRIDIAKQIIASKPDDLTHSLAFSMQWFPHFILAQQDKTKIPLFENLYEEMKQQNERHGRKYDQFTSNVMSTRGAVVRDLLKLTNDKKYLTQAEELLAEYDVLLKDKPLGKFAEQFYSNKFQFLGDLSQHGTQYQSAFSAFREQMRELLNTREDEMETTLFYFCCAPPASFATPEGQATQRAWMERITRRIAVMEDTEKRYGLYRVKGNIFYNFLRNDAATEEEYRAFIKELEVETGKGDPLSNHGNDIYNAYFMLFDRELQRLLKSDIITDEALRHFFASAKHMLYAGESAYGHCGRAFAMLVQDGDTLFARCTPDQQAFFIEAVTELLAETEKVEKEWIAAGKPMQNESELPPLRKFLGRLQLFGQEISLMGTTLDGKPFDLKSLRGKVVLLDFWATTCGPCIAEMPELKKHYEAFHARGFEIVGISIDMEEDKAKLVEFIQSRQLPWIQLHDPKDELFNQLHGFGVPYCLLLDREGKVILHDAREEALTRKLTELFPAK